MKRRNRAYRLLRLTAVYLLLLPFLLLGWLYSRLPDRVYLEPGQALLLPRFGWVEPMGLHGSQNAASTQVVGSYQTTLSLGGWFPIKNIRTVVTERAQVTVCGTPFGVKMFSEGALIVGFSDIDSPGGSTVNPAKAAGLRLGDRVIRIGQIRTENNDAVKEALEAARLGEFVAGLSKGMDTHVGECGCRLSGGQRQRIGIARALYRRADVLFFDEATSALDSRTEEEINRSVAELAARDKGLTLVVIAHRESSLEYCTRIITIGE